MKNKSCPFCGGTGTLQTNYSRKAVFTEIRQAVNRGEIKMWVNSFGYIIMQDTETNERLAVANVEDKWNTL